MNGYYYYYQHTSSHHKQELNPWLSIHNREKHIWIRVMALKATATYYYVSTKGHSSSTPCLRSPSLLRVRAPPLRVGAPPPQLRVRSPSLLRKLFSPLVRDFGEGLRPCGEGERRRMRRRFCFHLIAHWSLEGGEIQITFAIGSSWSLWGRIRSHRF